MASRTLPAVLAGLGLIALAGAVLLAAAARLLPSEGFQDLGRFVGALLLAAASGLLLGAALVTAGWLRARLPRWLVAVAAVACLLALVPAVTFLQVALPSSNVGLAAFAALVGVAALAGLASAPRAWRA